MPKLAPVSSTIDAGSIAAAGIARKNDLANLRKIDIAHIVDLGNVRETYVDIEELAASIEAHGLLQPISVKTFEADSGGIPRYELVAGFRRWKAFQHLNAQGKGFALIDAIIVSGEKLILQLIENLQRSDLTAREREHGIALMAESGVKQHDIGNLLSKGKGYISKHINAYRCRKIIEEAGITTSGIETGAMYIISTADDQSFPALAKALIEKGCTTAIAESLLSHYRENKKMDSSPAPDESLGEPQETVTDITDMDSITLPASSLPKKQGEEAIPEETALKTVAEKSVALEPKLQKFEKEDFGFPEKLVKMSAVGKVILDYIDGLAAHPGEEFLYRNSAAQDILALLHERLCND